MGLLSSITSGFGLLGGLIDSGNKKAANKATAAVTEAADKNRALFEQIYNQSRGDLAPYNQAGVSALQAATSRLGLGGNAPSGGYQGAGKATGGFAGVSPGEPGATAPQGGGGDFGAYLAANPDVAQWAQQSVGQTPPNWEGGVIDNPEEAAAYHYQAYGQGEGRQLDMTPAVVDPNAPPDYMNMRRPDAMEVPTYERGPAMSAPSLPSMNWQDIEKDPGFQWEMQQGLGAVNAASAARGKLRSGDAAKALQDRGYGIAHSKGSDYFNRSLNLFDRANQQYQYGQGRQDQNFLDDRSYGTNLWNTQQNRNDAVFDTDRGYQTNRYDTTTGNLFNLVNIGQNAAAGTANAGNIFASSTAGENNNVAQTKGNAALWRQGQVNNMFGSAMNLAGTFAGGGF